MKPAAELWVGRTRHIRHEPFKHDFSYRVAMVSVDVDRISEADRSARLFSIDRFNAVSLASRKYALGDQRGELRNWTKGKLTEAGCNAEIASVQLLTFPSVLGSGFAPISLWIARGAADRIVGVIYEVHNTFGEAHAYVFPAVDALREHHAEKEFHVSPFMDVAGRYRFRLTVTEEGLALVVDNMEDGECVHSARLALRARALNDAEIGKWLLRMPFSGFGVILAIHWQALKLWLKGARYRKKPEQRAARTTQAFASQSEVSVAQEDRRSA